MGQRTNAPPRRLLPAVAALLSALALGAPAAAQNLGRPDAPPVPAPAPGEVAPMTAALGSADAPPAPTSTPAPAPAPAPAAPASEDTPDTPASRAAPAGDTDAAVDARARARARAAAVAERARALRAAAQRKRMRTDIAAVRGAALDGGQALAVTPVANDSGGSDTGRQRILLVLLAAAALGFALAAYPPIASRGGALERARFELAGVSVACVLVLLLVVAGIV